MHSEFTRYSNVTKCKNISFLLYLLIKRLGFKDKISKIVSDPRCSFTPSMCREDYISITDNDGYRFWLKYAKDVRACGGLENYEAKRSALFKKATESLDPETWDGPYDKAVEAMNEQIEKFGVERVYNRTFGRHA